MNILETKGLVKKFPLRKKHPLEKRRFFTALNGVSLSLKKGEILGVVGESGCGKTTLVKVILGMEKPQEGRVFFRGEDLLGLSRTCYRQKRRKIQVVFQDPYSSLNPRMKVKDILSEPLAVNGYPREEREKIIGELMDKMSLSKNQLSKYAHEFSGGQRQRIAIARSLALNPEVIIADEPVSSLDISIQAQIINLLLKLRKDYDLSYLFISHDMAVIYHISDKVAVMNRGEIIEIARTREVFSNPLHPYTRMLLESVPKVGEKPKTPEITARRRATTRLFADRQIRDLQADGMGFSGHCGFSDKCPYFDEDCRGEKPELSEVFPGHLVKCVKSKSQRTGVNL